MSDRELVDRLLRGDESAAREFVLSHRFVVTGALRRFYQLTREDVEDLFQDIFARVFAQDCQILRQWHGENLAGYLRQIAKNAALDRLRTRPPQPEPIEDPPELPGVGDPETEALINQLRRMMLEAIRQLAPPDQEAVRLVDLEQLSYQEAALRLGVTRNNLGVRLTRARGRLANIITERYPALLAHLTGHV